MYLLVFESLNRYNKNGPFHCEPSRFFGSKVHLLTKVPALVWIHLVDILLILRV